MKLLRVPLALTLLSVAALVGCHSEPYCLNCIDGGTVSLDGGRTDAAGDRTDTGTPDVREAAVDVQDVQDVGTPDGCDPAAMELCNGVDDNCNGRIDEGFDVQSDPRNCGMCGRLCNLPHAIPVCSMGTCGIAPMGCDTNFYDLDGNAANGCEYACVPVPGATNDSTCDNRDDNCNGRVDEDVDLCADTANCGRCGRGCGTLPNATGQCRRTDGMTTGACTMANTACAVRTCAAGFYDIDGDPANGCEYACTPSASGMEVCNGADDNCNGMIDEGNPGAGVVCGSNVGTCRQGMTACTMGRIVCMGAVMPSAEVCDGMDNDCNGMTDDGTLSADPMVGIACGSGVGDCRPGRNTCTGGRVVCTGATGPQAERCDGRDNDCDGMVDNGNPGGGAACGSAMGTCMQGALTCVGGTLTCRGGRGPSTEVCDGMDNDCNGVVDNGFNLQTDPVNCGRCGTSCAVTGGHASTTCRTGACVIVSCEPGFYDVDRNPANGCEVACSGVPGGTEVCNGIDDNCNGMIDEGVTAPTNFCRTMGPCAGATASCTGGRFVCNYPTGAGIEIDPMTNQPRALEAVCDGIDGNCNGAVDETWSNLNTTCSSAGVGACASTGRYVCNAARTGTTCNAAATGTPTAELCDGIDNDCDGSIDETRAAPGTNAFYVQDSWVQINTSVWEMTYEASRPNADAMNQGNLSNRPCSVANRLPWTNLTYPQAATACASIGARLCSPAEWQRSCETTTAPACGWSFLGGAGASRNCLTYSRTTCNTFDLGRAALTPTGSLASCASDWAAAGQVFDLTGNAREFVSGGTTTSRSVRGGGFDNIAFGTTCQFNWTVVDDTFAFPNTGFRCCRDTAP